MYKCPNCNKMSMLYDTNSGKLICYGRCHLILNVSEKETIQECIDRFRRSQHGRRV